MSQTERLNALAITRNLLTAMPGWKLDANTERAIREHDGDGRHWAGIENPAYPGADVSVNTSHHAGRLHITARYPRDWEPYIEGGRGRTYTESITVSASKTPEQIARDIKRRLFEETGYLTHLAGCLARKAESEQGYDKAEVLARELAAMVDTTTTYDRMADWQRKNPDRGSVSHNLTDDNRKKFEVHDSTSYQDRVSGEVSHGAQSVSLTFSHLTPSQAIKLLTAWKGTK